jgi:hypothetical protein
MSDNNYIKNKPLLNHLKAILKAKPYINTKSPQKYIFEKQNKSKAIRYNYDEANNIKKTYDGIFNIKPRVNSSKPKTIKMGKTKFTKVASHEDQEHIRRLTAISKRITYFGSENDRKKKKEDPIMNPVYFFRSPNDKKATKLVELNKFNEKIEELNKKAEKSDFYIKQTNILQKERINSATNHFKPGASSSFERNNFISSGKIRGFSSKIKIPSEELKSLKYKYDSKLLLLVIINM